jgi:orotidine-5'-phosphate decarboxylase
VGLNLFVQAGPAAVEQVHQHGGKVFLDLKFHDIPNTVSGTVRAAAGLKVWMANVHIQGGSAMMRAAFAAARGNGLLLIGVTVLTSMAEKDLAELGVRNPVQTQVLSLAKLAASAGLNGVIASAQEAAAIRGACGEKFLIVTPGIRPKDKRVDDQRRTATPLEAIRAGADYLVVGRPILEAPDPAAAARRIIEECADATK